MGGTPAAASNAGTRGTAGDAGRFGAEAPRGGTSAGVVETAGLPGPSTSRFAPGAGLLGYTATLPWVWRSILRHTRSPSMSKRPAGGGKRQHCSREGLWKNDGASHRARAGQRGSNRTRRVVDACMVSPSSHVTCDREARIAAVDPQLAESDWHVPRCLHCAQEPEKRWDDAVNGVSWPSLGG